MALDAAVVTDRDADTGDASQVLADARLGNAAMIAHLLARAMATFGPNSILVRKVLYSGSHGGDFLDQQSVRMLAGELRSWEDNDDDVAHFKRTKLHLTDTAIKHDAFILF